MRQITRWLTVTICVLPAIGVVADDDEAVDYTKQIQPILKKHCFKCHSADKQESGFRIDSVSKAIEGGDRGEAIVPGDSEKSLLYQVITIEDGDVERMPQDAPPLSDEEIELIRAWIDEGAVAPEGADDGDVKSDHWSFQSVIRTQPPIGPLRDASDAIDAFVRHRLTAEGLAPSSEATKATLIRRVSLDLLGLLPDVADVTRFTADESPDAYDRLVDRTLASPHYGERWGRHWLDIARYADSNGYTIDGPRSIWKYRDWVINAINSDRPYDQFSIEQLAGDLIPDATVDQIIATGFHRNTLINQEGGTDQEQYRVDSLYDRISTTGTVWMGLTVGCAQCHSHKFDPVSQREFYKLFAIFNQCDEPNMPIPSADQAAEQDRLKTELAAAEKPLKDYDLELMKGLSAWEERLAAVAGEPVAWTILKPLALSGEKGSLLVRQDDDSIFSDFSVPANDTFVVGSESEQEVITAIRLEALTHESLPNRGPGRADNGNFVLNEFELDIVVDGNVRPVKFTNAVADHSQSGFDINAAIDSDQKTGWAINVSKGSLNVDREATFFPSEPITVPVGTKLTFRLRHLHKDAKYLLGRFRLSATSAPAEQLTTPKAIRDIAAIGADKRKKEQQAQLATYFRSLDAGRKPFADRVENLKKAADTLKRQIPTTMVMRKRGEARQTHVHIRGDFLRKGDEVAGGVPAVLHDLSDDIEEPTRLDFANWLFDPNSPMTSRVTVNRFWQRFFGKGLVETENDFGTQGSLPTHPELLDWIASEFQRREWGTKSIHRLIVTSATYRQSSNATQELLARDPSNKLLARQSRLRLEAEVIRDVALSASGFLSDHMTGPGVYPPQPEGLYIVTQVKKAWPESKGEARHRRAIYTYLWRSSLYPMFPTFDAPDANNACTQRSRSNTPLQALTLANDRAFIELSNGLAKRVVEEAPEYDEGRIRHTFQVCLARDPADVEKDVLLRFLKRQRESAEGDNKELAAWTAVTRVVMNMDEFITRE